ncbi:MAG: cytochrome P450 [Hyphomicrobiaceae bacterium]|nr:MAG: cytochrome P450 [Hyphomicrobiaceae bacterium]
MPREIYEEPIVVRSIGRRVFVYVAGSELIKTVFVDERENFPKTPLEKRVLGPLLGDGLLTTEGAAWKWQRQTVAALFRPQDLLSFVPAMVAAAESMVAQWRQAGQGAEREIDHDMMRATFAVIADTLLKDENNTVGSVVERSSASYLLPITWSIFYAMMGVPQWAPHPGRGAMRRSERDLRAAVETLVTSRRRQGAETRDDLLARLMKARHPETGKLMSDRQIADNLLTFFLAGHETTAKALAWTLYVVSEAPQWEARMLAEIEAVVGEGPVKAEHVARLVTVEQVLKESMRLFPPAPVMTRHTREATKLGGLDIPADASIVVPIYAIHRHKAYWPDADRFDPTRFTPERERQMARYQYMPFGAGPRICIGQAFAMIEAVSMLATFLRRARFASPPGGRRPEPISRVTLRPRGGLPLLVSMR